MTCAIFKLGISEIPSLLEPYCLTILPQSSIEKAFVFFFLKKKQTKTKSEKDNPSL